MKERAIFYKYLQQIQEIYESSDIRKNPQKNNWYYSLCSTPVYLNGIVISGFNWGVGNDHDPQHCYPDRDFMKETDLGSLSRIKPYLRQYFSIEDLDRITQINLCFFRSKVEKDINLRDLELNIPIFRSIIKELKPKVLIALSSKVYSALQDSLVNVKEKELANGAKSITTFKACLNEEFGNGRFVYVPHPNYPLRADARKEIWEYGLG